jgi:hypothetical protein
MVAEGNQQKRRYADLREQTVRSYKTMMKKLGVNNVAGLTQLAPTGPRSWGAQDARSEPTQAGLGPLWWPTPTSISFVTLLRFWRRRD